jgi:hypothetical protein
LLDEAMANLDARHAAPLQAILAAGPWTMVAANHAAPPNLLIMHSKA